MNYVLIVRLLNENVEHRIQTYRSKVSATKAGYAFCESYNQSHPDSAASFYVLTEEKEE